MSNQGTFSSRHYLGSNPGPFEFGAAFSLLSMKETNTILSDQPTLVVGKYE